MINFDWFQMLGSIAVFLILIGVAVLNWLHSNKRIRFSNRAFFWSVVTLWALVKIFF